MQKRPSAERRAVVLGGGGFIGTNLSRALVHAGCAVTAVSRTFHFREALAGIDCRSAEFDDVSAFEAALSPDTVVYHLAQGVGPGSANIGQIDRILESSRRVLDICCKAGVQRLVFVSSGGTVYGAASHYPTRETAPTFPRSAYALINLALENLIMGRFGPQEHRIMRLSNPYGPRQLTIKKQGIVTTLVNNALEGRATTIWGDGSVVRDFVYIDDVIDALILCAKDNSPHSIMNIGSGVGRSLLEVIAAVEEALDARVEVVWRRSRAVDLPVSILSIDRARSCLGWQPKVTFDEGLRLTIQAWREMKTRLNT